MKPSVIEPTTREKVSRSNDNFASVFESGLTFEDYVASMAINQKEILAHFDQIRFTGEQEKTIFEVISPYEELLAVVITEDWCPDSLWNLPILIRISEIASNLKVRIVRRIDFQEFAKSYPGDDGKSHIPTIVFFNLNHGELDYWSERSNAQQKWVAEFFKHHPRPRMLLKNNLPEPEFKRWIRLRIENEREVFQRELWVETLNELLALIRSYPKT